MPARLPVLLLLCASVLGSAGCATTVRFPAGLETSPGDAADALVEFSYTVKRGGSLGRWVLESPGVRTLVDGVQLPAFEIHIFDDDGDGVMQPDEVSSSVAYRTEIQNTFVYFGRIVIEHEVQDPWIHARAETSAGVVERTWRFEAP